MHHCLDFVKWWHARSPKYTRNEVSWKIKPNEEVVKINCKFILLYIFICLTGIRKVIINNSIDVSHWAYNFFSEFILIFLSRAIGCLANEKLWSLNHRQERNGLYVYHRTHTLWNAVLLSVWISLNCLYI